MQSSCGLIGRPSNRLPGNTGLPAKRAMTLKDRTGEPRLILFPAIDLKDGLCVRLEQGDMARATVFHRDPAAQAHAFAQQGFEYLHVVDLDGAFAGKPV